LTFIGLQGDISKKIELFTTTAVRNSNLTTGKTFCKKNAEIFNVKADGTDSNGRGLRGQ
jgi:hypothetical protein